DVRGGGLRELRALPPRGDQIEVADVDVLVEVGIGGDRLQCDIETELVEIRLHLPGTIGVRLDVRRDQERQRELLPVLRADVTVAELPAGLVEELTGTLGSKSDRNDVGGHVGILVGSHAGNEYEVILRYI